MKYRTGFVSNSSSSSFIIKSEIVKDNCLNTLKVLRQFLHVQKQEIIDWLNYRKDVSTKDVIESHKAYQQVLEWIDKNENTKENPIFQFPSCNYDTYIWKLKDGSIKISTCNNTNWNDALEAVKAEWDSSGADDSDWPDMPMAKQPCEWDPQYEITRPDERKIIVLKPDTKFSNLPVLYKPQEQKCRFTALLDEQ